MTNKPQSPNRILVIGSSNTDMVIKTAKLPAPGETILGGFFLLNPGGKGANQAVAIARLSGTSQANIHFSHNSRVRYFPSESNHRKRLPKHPVPRIPLRTPFVLQR